MSTQRTSVLPSADSLLDRIPNWVGFGLIILVGVLAIIFGLAVTKSPGLVAFGVAAIASSIIAWVNGAKSKPDVGWISFGASVRNIDGWAWVIVFLLFVAAVVVAVVFH